VTPSGEEICVITYKKLTNTFYGNRESVISVRVEDYDSAIELFQEIGLIRQSIQENRRSKFICDYNNDNYVVSIDEWPGLSEIRFVIVQSVSTIEHESLIDFAESLNLKKEKLNKKGVDAIYKSYLNFAISDIPELDFSLIDKLIKERKQFETQ